MLPGSSVVTSLLTLFFSVKQSTSCLLWTGSRVEVIHHCADTHTELMINFSRIMEFRAEWVNMTSDIQASIPAKQNTTKLGRYFFVCVSLTQSSVATRHHFGKKCKMIFWDDQKAVANKFFDGNP